MAGVEGSQGRPEAQPLMPSPQHPPGVSQGRGVGQGAIAIRQTRHPLPPPPLGRERPLFPARSVLRAPAGPTRLLHEMRPGVQSGAEVPGERHLGEGDSPFSRGSALGLEASLSGVSRISRVPGRQGEGPGPCSPCSVPHWLLGDGLAVEAGLVSVLPLGPLPHSLCFFRPGASPWS